MLVNGSLSSLSGVARSLGSIDRNAVDNQDAGNRLLRDEAELL